ncbi:MAG: T9SS type B sorting domain-containing protein, partial [Cytophagaceae bacterium]
YGVTATFQNTTCSATDSVTIEYYPEVIPNNPANLVACNNLGFAEFTLSNANADILSGLNPANFTVTYYLTEQEATTEVGTPLTNLYTNVTANQQVVYARVESAAGCFGVVALTLVVQDLAPVFTVTPTEATICDGSSQTISVVPGNFDAAAATYSWTVGGQPLADTTSSITVTVGGTYEVTVNNAGCTGTATSVITVVPGPVAPADVVVCNSYTLPALPSGGNYFSATGGQGPLSPGDVITTEGVTTIYVYDPNCPNEDSFTVTISNLVAQVPTSASGCSSYVLPDLPANQAYYTAAGGPTGTGTIIPEGSTITVDQTVVYVYADNGSCIDEASFTVTIGALITDILPDVTRCDSYVLPALSANNHYWTGAGCTGTELFAGDVIGQTQIIYICSNQGTCTGNVEDFQVTINQTPVLAPVSNLADCTSVTLPSLSVGAYYTDPLGVGPITNLTYTTPGTYTVYVYATSGTNPDCPSATNPSFTVTIYGQPDVDDLTSVNLCQGATYTLPTLISGTYYSGPGGTGTTFAPGYVVSQSMDFFIFADNGGGCTDETTFSVTVSGTPEFTITGGCQGNVFQLTAEPVAGSYDPATATYLWSTSNGSIVSGGDTATVTVSGPGTYSLTVTAQGCDGQGSLSPTSTSCTIQKGISANGDGANDFFDLEGFNVGRLQIFNRYGLKVYERRNYTNQWKGQSDKGDELPDGTYYYVIERTDGEPTQTGWIYINRKN